MKSYTNTRAIVCLGCASIIKAPRDQWINCPACGYRNDRVRCVRLLEHAAEAVLCGYEYRIQYEGAGCRAAYYLPSPADALVWVALAALGGIIGNATYDLTKCAIGRIVAQLRGKRDHKVLAAQEKFELFLRYVKEYPQGLPSATWEIRHMVSMEVLAHRKELQDSHDRERTARNAVMHAELAVQHSGDAFEADDDLWPGDLWTNLSKDSSDKS